MKNIILFLIASLVCSSSFSQHTLKIIGGNVKVTDNVIIVLKDCQLQNESAFNASNGTVEMKGTISQSLSEIGGIGTYSFHNLKINKSANDAQLGTNITVNNQIEMVSGNLDLGANDLTLGTNNGMIVGESESNRITSTATGQIVKTIDLNAPTAENPGNIGIEITSSANLGTTEIRRGHDHQTIPTGSSIFRHFTINPANNSGLAASLNFKYFDAELNGITENSLVLLENNGGWMIDGFNNRDFGSNTITFSEYDGLFQYTLGRTTNDNDEDGSSDDVDNCPDNTNVNQTDIDNDMVGDVCDSCPNGDDLVDANGNDIIDDCECQDIDLYLTGEDEYMKNKTYIADNTIISKEIINSERSVIYKAGTSITLINEFHAKAGASFLAVIADCQNPALLILPGVAAKQVKSMATLLENSELQVFPNPFVKKTTISYYVPQKGKTSLTIQDMKGQQLAVLKEEQVVDKGNYQLDWKSQNLSSGMYILMLQTEQQTISKKLVVAE